VGKYGEAARQFDRVLKINSRYPRAHVMLGRVFLRLNEGKKALEEAGQEKSINPDLGDAFLLSAEAYFMLKQYSNCAGEYQKAVRRVRSATILVRMARCYRLANALDSAQSLLRQAQALENGNPDLYKEQGAIFQMKGMADEAIAAYDTYLKLVPTASDKSEIESRIRRVQSGDTSVGD
jgi:tetratricopeptide (TPR) repeat protein